MPRSGSFTLPKAVVRGADSVLVRLRSSSGKNEDFVRISLAQPRPELALGTSSAMPKCASTVKIDHKVNQGKVQINVSLKNVGVCDTFTIESNNGNSIQKAYKISGGKKGKRSASFTLSWDKVIDKGQWDFKKNNIDIKVSGPGGVADLFVVAFLAAE